jgi:membrane-associated phospholipid phosphatase
VLVLAATDNVNVLSPGAPPVGPGYWVSSGAALVRGNYGARPFFLATQDELRSPPPPAFGSSAFLAALAEVRALSDGRTPEQLAISRKWAPFGGPLFHDLARELIVKHRRSEVEAARIMAYASTASFDAIIACFDTKFAYWFLRPTHADPAITTAVPLPNHPSYPSAHSCENGAYMAVLTDAFPSERSRIAAAADEASMSRVLGGLHYRFDADAGLTIGQRAGELALARRGLEQ